MAPIAFRCNFRVKDAISENVRAGAAGYCEIDPEDYVAAAAKKDPVVKAERNLERVEKLIELFEPFILFNEHDFAADNIEKLSHALVEERAERIWIQRANS